MEGYLKVPNINNTHILPTALTCPHCQTTMVPKFLYGVKFPDTWSEISDDPTLIMFSVCTQKKCKGVFLSTFEREVVATHTSDNSSHTYFHNSEVLYYQGFEESPEEIEVYERIIEKRPYYRSFLEIYTQAHTAENSSLDHIAGMGYRKALEFLIKDYAKYLQPDHQSKIERASVSSVINDYLSVDSMLVDISKRATWLGNDEVHYLKKWIEKDVNDLKKVIILTLQTIEHIESTKEYIRDMETPR